MATVSNSGATRPGQSVVVPVYNGADTIGLLAERVARVFADARSWELIFVVDGGHDRSWETVVGLAEHDSHVRGIELFRNFGQANATLAGIRQARYDTVVTMDDDLQHRPETIPSLLEILTPDVDLVYGQPVRDEHSWWRNASSRVVKRSIAAASGTGRIVHDASAFRAFRTSMRDGFANVDNPDVAIDVMLSWVTTRYATCAVPMDQRANGESAYTFPSLLRHSLNLITGYSAKPLRLAVSISIAFVVGTALLVATAPWHLAGRTIGGGTSAHSVAALFAIVGCVQLIVLGVIGEYLGRVHSRTLGRPGYVVRRSVGIPPALDP
jgi:Glycosyl transferase family 2